MLLLYYNDNIEEGLKFNKTFFKNKYGFSGSSITHFDKKNF